MEWKRVAMDGSRTGVVPVNAENVDTALGAFEDDYIAPNGRHFTDGATPEVAAMLMEVQPRMAHLKEVVGHNARFMDNPRTECDLPIGNLVADALRAKAADYFQIPVEFALTNYGGIRIPMPEGAVTLDDIESMFPFKKLRRHPHPDAGRGRHPGRHRVHVPVQELHVPGEAAGE